MCTGIACCMLDTTMNNIFGSQIPRPCCDSSRVPIKLKSGT